MIKTCTKCDIEKSLDDFHKSSKGKYGRRATCKVCMSEYYKRNKEKIILKAHDRYIENIEEISKYNEKYRKDNREKLKEYFKEYHKNNRDKILKRVDRWRNENREQYNLNMKAAKHRRRARIKENGNNTLTAKEIKMLFGFIENCTYCGIQDNLTLDHIIPISKGGQNCLKNVTIACASCNSRKGNKIIDDLTITHATFA